MSRLSRRVRQSAYFALKDQYLMFRRERVAFLLPNLRFDIRYLHNQVKVMYYDAHLMKHWYRCQHAGA